MRGSCKRASNLLSRAIALLFLVLVITASAQAVTVRGKLERKDRYGKRYEAAYVRVTLCNSRNERSAAAYTGTDGMYYLYNVPAGNYYLEVWLDPDKPIRYWIEVKNDSYHDIPPIDLD